MGDRQKLQTTRELTSPGLERLTPPELPQGNPRPRTGPSGFLPDRAFDPTFDPALGPAVPAVPADDSELSDPRTVTGSRRMASGTGTPQASGPPASHAVPANRAPLFAAAALAPHEAPQTVVAFLRDPSLIRFLAQEFRHLDATLRILYSHTEMTTSLLHDPSAHPRVLLVSIDELSFEELYAIKRVRAAGWRGTTIALSRGRMLPALRGALGIDRLLTPTFVQDVFGDLLRELAPDHS